MTAPAFAFWTQLLALPDYEVVYCQKESDLHCYRFTLSPTHRFGVCPHCGKVTDTVHQTRSRERIKDLPIGPDSVELTVRVLQFQ
jgi:transposase